METKGIELSLPWMACMPCIGDDAGRPEEGYMMAWGDKTARSVR